MKAQRTYRIIYNCDSDGALREPPPMTEDQFFKRINGLEGSQVDCFNYCVCAGDMIAFYPSKVTDLITDPKHVPVGAMDCADNLRYFYSEGKDPIRLHAKRARELGMDFFASVRLNDSHHKSKPDGPFASPFWKERQEYRNWEVTDGACYYNATLNFKYPEVRERRMNVIREVIENYEMDGIELDFGRNPYFFNPSEAWDKRDILTDFFREVRELANSHGRRLMIRVPFYNRKLRNGGLDLEAWINQKLADIYIITCLKGNDPLTDLTPWAKKIHATGALLYGGIEMDIASNAALNHNTVCKPADLRGAAFNHHAQGADGVALFNCADMLGLSAHAPAMDAAYRKTLHQLGTAETLKGTSKCFGYYKNLPAELEVGRPEQFHQTFPLLVASQQLLEEDAIPEIELKITNAHDVDAFRFTLNGNEISSDHIVAKWEHQGLDRGGLVVRASRSGHNIGPYYRTFTLTPERTYFQGGENKLGISMVSGPRVEHTFIKVYDIKLQVTPKPNVV